LELQPRRRPDKASGAAQPRSEGRNFLQVVIESLQALENVTDSSEMKKAAILVGHHMFL
jgi:hypothetical protein